MEVEASKSREAVAVFDSAVSFQEAIDELLSAGLDRADLSRLASEQAVTEMLGHRYEKVGELEDEVAVPRTAYVSTGSIGDAQGGLVGGPMYVGATAAAGAVVASGGSLLAIIAAAAIAGGAGGLVGSILAKWVGDHHGQYLQEQLDHGGLLLWVRTVDARHEGRAVEVLSKHSGCEVHVHEMPSST